VALADLSRAQALGRECRPRQVGAKKQLDYLPAIWEALGKHTALPHQSNLNCGPFWMSCAVCPRVKSLKNLTGAGSKRRQMGDGTPCRSFVFVSGSPRFRTGKQ